MKKSISILMATFLLLLFVPVQLSANEDNDKATTSVKSEAESARVDILVERLYEIQAMDIPSMKSVEKKALRKEVRSIKKELKTINDSPSNPPANVPPPAVANGVYISAGGIIIILLLLILLL